ncbi:hypothetical protein RHSIM_Rhsim05G0220100 [Rhododendron simsii]|uniref:Uncharacterized protein n=1 Tax=Rhododendron simsii TaxID=118357 RepID=A0A834GW13_RHOSS|nr:hypothetical protein RHSIM_Rhsim05G0220100 [Rhododendron simsii]
MLSGTIPQCLIENCTETLGVLNLGNNNLSGNIFGIFPQGCVLKTLDLNGNHLEGNVPESLSNCVMLEVLNLGSNNMNGNFPSFLEYLSNLHVLVLRSNGFQGGIRCPGLNTSTWPKLQIIDLPLNNFSGHLPPKCFLHWNAMMIDRSYSHLRNEFLKFNNFYYQDKVTVTQKGQEMELVKILTLFTAIDFSGKSFEGEIPDTIGALRLCGAPLIANCAGVEPTRPTLDGRQSYTDEDEINWTYVTATLGYTVGFGVIVGPLLYSKRWRQWYYKPVDRVIVRILHHREQQARHQRRRDNRNQLRRRQHH